MITRPQALEHGHSPMLWGLLAAAATELVVVIVWNGWDRREQLRALAGRLLRP
jgi:hypothetical protein